MKGWAVVTGATSAPSSAAITSLLPHAESTAAYLLQRPAVVSSGVDRSRQGQQDPQLHRACVRLTCEESTSGSALLCRSATSQQGDSSTPPHAPTPSPLLGGSSSLGLDHFCTPQILVRPAALGTMWEPDPRTTTLLTCSLRLLCCLPAGSGLRSPSGHAAWHPRDAQHAAEAAGATDSHRGPQQWTQRQRTPEPSRQPASEDSR